MHPGDTVVEIGPGRGALTRHLLQPARLVVAVELDTLLAKALRKRCGMPENLKVIRKDILHCDLPSLAGQAPRSQTVMTGNLPYYVTSPVLRAVFAAQLSFRSATFLMQEEVANRATAGPGGRTYGFLSCLCRLHSEPTKLFSVPPGAFSPPPKVWSAAVRFDLRKQAPPEGLGAFLGNCFRAPRKTLRNNLSGIYPRRRVSADPCAGLRAQQLGIEYLVALWHRLRSS